MASIVNQPFDGGVELHNAQSSCFFSPLDVHLHFTGIHFKRTKKVKCKICSWYVWVGVFECSSYGVLALPEIDWLCLDRISEIPIFSRIKPGARFNLFIKPTFCYISHKKCKLSYAFLSFCGDLQWVSLVRSYLHPLLMRQLAPKEMFEKCDWPQWKQNQSRFPYLCFYELA